MRKANCTSTERLVQKRLAETRMSESDRGRAMEALRSAELIVDAIIWVKERFTAVGAYFLKPGFKN